VSKDFEAKKDRLNRAAASVLSAARRDHEPPITQEELAANLGTTRNVVANIDSARKEIAVSELILISQELHLDPEKVFKLVLGFAGISKRK